MYGIGTPSELQQKLASRRTRRPVGQSPRLVGQSPRTLETRTLPRVTPSVAPPIRPPYSTMPRPPTGPPPPRPPTGPPPPPGWMDDPSGKPTNDPPPPRKWVGRPRPPPPRNKEWIENQLRNYNDLSKGEKKELTNALKGYEDPSLKTQQWVDVQNLTLKINELDAEIQDTEIQDKKEELIDEKRILENDLNKLILTLYKKPSFFDKLKFWKNGGGNALVRGGGGCAAKLVSAMIGIVIMVVVLCNLIPKVQGVSQNKYAKYGLGFLVGILAGLAGIAGYEAMNNIFEKCTPKDQFNTLNKG